MSIKLFVFLALVRSEKKPSHPHISVIGIEKFLGSIN